MKLTQIIFSVIYGYPVIISDQTTDHTTQQPPHVEQHYSKKKKKKFNRRLVSEEFNVRYYLLSNVLFDCLSYFLNLLTFLFIAFINIFFYLIIA